MIVNAMTDNDSKHSHTNRETGFNQPRGRGDTGNERGFNWKLELFVSWRGLNVLWKSASIILRAC